MSSSLQKNENSPVLQSEQMVALVFWAWVRGAIFFKSKGQAFYKAKGNSHYLLGLRMLLPLPMPTLLWLLNPSRQSLNFCTWQMRLFILLFLLTGLSFRSRTFLQLPPPFHTDYAPGTFNWTGASCTTWVDSLLVKLPGEIAHRHSATYNSRTS